jgi:hypothetical protein
MTQLIADFTSKTMNARQQKNDMLKGIKQVSTKQKKQFSKINANKKFLRNSREQGTNSQKRIKSPKNSECVYKYKGINQTHTILSLEFFLK